MGQGGSVSTRGDLRRLCGGRGPGWSVCMEGLLQGEAPSSSHMGGACTPRALLQSTGKEGAWESCGYGHLPGILSDPLSLPLVAQQ